jgi:MFS family permease
MFTRLGINPRFDTSHTLAFVLLVNSFSWLFISQKMIGDMQNPVLSLVFPLAIVLSSLAGAFGLTKVDRVKLLTGWLLLGVVASLSLGVSTASPTAELAVTAAIGASFGFGIPSCLAYFADCVPIEKRGKVGGISLFATTLSVSLMAWILSTELSTIIETAIFAGWRAWSLPLLLLLSKNTARKTERKIPSVFEIFRSRTYLLYFAAWLIFSLVDSFEARVLANSPSDYPAFLAAVLEPLFAGFSALVAGVISDWIGRKRVLIFGFVSLGLAYAIVSLASGIWAGPGEVPIEAWFVYFMADGVAIGILWVLFVLTIWGDLSLGSSEKHYAIGQAPFFLAMVTFELFGSIAGLTLESSFSLAAFFLFMAVLPLWSARETLPEKRILKRQLETYTEEAMRLRRKAEQSMK